MGHIPAFPHFTNLSLSHSDFLQSVTKHFPPYSDYSFISLYCWDTDETIGVASLHNNLIVRFSDYHSGHVFLSLLGTNMLGDTLETLFEFSKSMGFGTQLRLIPHAVVEALDRKTEAVYDIVEDRDNHDYIISTEDASQGQIGRRKRAAARHFRETYGEAAKTLTLNLEDKQILHEIEGLLLEWRATRGMQESDIKESAAIQRCLTHATELGVRGIATYINGRMVGFILFDTLEKHTAIVHFGKADRSYRGLFDNLKLELAKHLYHEGVAYMNFEQDLGIEGLRGDKMALRPVEFLQKYTIEKRS